MVLNDITNDYTHFIDLLEKYDSDNSFIASALDLINSYHEKINRLADQFLKSPKRESDKSTLISGLNTLERDYSTQIAHMNSSMRSTTRLITEIEHMEFSSPSVQSNAVFLRKCLNQLMEIIEEYAANKIQGKGNTQTFFQLISMLEVLKQTHGEIYANCNILFNIEDELLEKLPFEDSEDPNFYTLDIRSCKPELDISSFSDDLKLLADCLQNLERLLPPTPTRSIYLRKIESGSLKAIFGSNTVDFSIFPDLITSISNAIRAWRLTPAEKEKALAESELLRAQAEEQRIKNEGSKMAIINSQIDFICEKLKLDPKESQEQIQKFCYPLIQYLENNPIGSINDIAYDISKEVHLLEDSTHND